MPPSGGGRRARARALVPASLLLPAVGLFGVCFFVPLAILLSLSFRRVVIGQPSDDGLTLSNYVQFLTDPFYLATLWDTLLLGLGVTALTLVLGYPMAFVVARAPGRWRGVLRLLVLTPLLVSVVIRTYGWMILLGGNGPVNQALLALGLIGTPIRFLFTHKAVLIGLVHVELPVMILALAGVIERIDPHLEEAAESLQANPIRSFLAVTLPLSLPGVAAGCMLVFSVSIAAFVTPALLGGPSLLVLATLMYQQIMVVLDWSFGATAGVILLAACASLFVLYQLLMALGRLWGGGQ